MLKKLSLPLAFGASAVAGQPGMEGMDPAMMEQLMASMGKGGGGGKGGMPGMEDMMAQMGGGGGMPGMGDMGKGMGDMMGGKGGKGKGKGKGPTCNAATGEDCSEKEKGYLKKMEKKTDEEKKKEFERLKAILTTKGVEKNVGGEQGGWMAARASILQQMVEPQAAPAEEDEEL